MEEQRLEILRKVANGELMPEQADVQLLSLSIVGNSSLYEAGQRFLSKGIRLPSSNLSHWRDCDCGRNIEDKPIGGINDW